MCYYNNLIITYIFLHLNECRGSWTKQLQNHFRNIHRKQHQQSSGLTFTPPPKKWKLNYTQNHGPDHHLQEILDDDSYESNIKQLQRQLYKPVKNKAAITSLMAETSANRRKWILDDRPLIAEITEKFPALKDFNIVCIYKYTCG